MTITDDDRTTAVGLYHFAISYQRCADELRERPPQALMFDEPIQFLYWHAAEFFLKAYLRAAGRSLNDLKRLGHNHAALHADCVQRGLALGKYPEAFFDFTGPNEPLDARYIVTGPKQLPSLDAFSKLCEELHQAVRADFKARKFPVR